MSPPMWQKMKAGEEPKKKVGKNVKCALACIKELCIELLWQENVERLRALEDCNNRIEVQKAKKLLKYNHGYIVCR